MNEWEFRYGLPMTKVSKLTTLTTVIKPATRKEERDYQMAKKKTKTKPAAKRARPHLGPRKIPAAPKLKKRTLSSELIAKMQAGRIAAKAAKAGQPGLKSVPANPTVQTNHGPRVRIVQLAPVFDFSFKPVTDDANAKPGLLRMFGLGDDNRVYFWSYSEGQWLPNWQENDVTFKAPAQVAVDPLS